MHLSGTKHSSWCFRNTMNWAPGSVLQNAVKHTYSSLGFQNFSGGNTPGAPAYKGRGGKGEEGGKGPHNNVCLRAPTNLNPALRFIGFQNIAFTTLVTDERRNGRTDRSRTHNASARQSGLVWRSHKNIPAEGMLHTLCCGCFRNGVNDAYAGGRAWSHSHDFVIIYRTGSKTADCIAVSSNKKQIPVRKLSMVTHATHGTIGTSKAYA